MNIKTLILSAVALAIIASATISAVAEGVPQNGIVAGEDVASIEREPVKEPN